MYKIYCFVHVFRYEDMLRTTIFKEGLKEIPGEQKSRF